jgi:autotransporter-associated beta strand protein
VNWSNTIPYGVDAVADFTTLNITVDSFVNNDAPRTVGQLLFGDISPSHNWMLTNAALTLATTLVQPVIDVRDQTLTIHAVLQGTQGFVKQGSGTLKLDGTNTYSGTTRVNAGILEIGLGGLGNGDLIISSGAKVALNYTGNKNIAALTLGGVLQPDGTYGSTASPATYQNDTYFSGTGTVTSGMRNQTITFGPLPAKTYGDAPFGLTATASSLLTVSYESSDPTVASVSGSTVTILKAGTAVITASQAGDVLYFPATPVQQTLTVNKADQAITFGALPAKVYGDATFALTATASSGLAVSYASSNTAVATVSGSSVTLHQVGSATLYATQDGNVNYNAATTVPQTLTVAPLPVALAGTRTYDATTAVAVADLSITNKVSGDDVTLSGIVALTNKNVGAQMVLGNMAFSTPIRMQSATNSTGADAATSFVVTLGATPANSNTLVAVISTRGTSSDRVTGITGGGVTWSRASQAANANGVTTEIWYGPNVSGGTTAITISQDSLLSAAVVMEYSGILAATPLDQIANATGASTNAVTGTTPSTTQASELWIGGIGLSGSTYTLGAALNGFASITNAQTGSATATNNAHVYALEAITNVTGLAASGGAVSGTQYAVITQRGGATTAQWASGSTLTINKPTEVVAGDVMLVCISQHDTAGTPTAANLSGWTLVKSGTLGGNATDYGTILVKVAGSSEGSSYTFNLVGTVGGAVGDIVAFSGVDNTTPVDAVAAAFTSSVGRSTTVSATTINTQTDNAMAILFGMAANASTASSQTWSDWLSGLSATPLFSNIGAGAAASATSVAANWKMMATAGATGAGQATLSRSERNAGIWVALRPATLPVEWSGAIATFKTAPAASIFLNGADAPNYTLTGMSCTMTITPKALTLTGTTTTNKIYDATQTAALTNGALLTAEAPGAGTTSDGKPYTGDTVNVALSGTFDTKDVGINKAVTSTSALTGDQAANYTLTQPASLTADITPKALTVEDAAVASKAYDATTNATFSTGGLKPAEAPGTGSTSDNTPYTGDAVGVSLSGFFASLDVGASIAVTSTSSLTGAQAANYSFTQLAGLTGAITNAPLTVTADNQSKFWDQALPFGSGSTLFSSSGLVAGETIGTVTLACIGGAAGSAVGTYEIMPSAPTGGTFTSANYAITYAVGTLTVNPAGQTITFGALTAKTYGDAPFSLTATASSLLTVSYSSSDTSVATVSGSMVTILKAGTTTITATQAGDANWAPATPVPQTLTVNQATQTITFDVLAAKTYGDAPFALTATASSGLEVSYSSSDTNVAMVVSNLVTILQAGSTTLTATQAGNGNYGAASPVQRVLTVNAASQTITFSALAAKTYGDAPFALTATASSGLEVSYSSSDTNVATVESNLVTILQVGATTITATQAGNTNYTAATPVPQTLTVNKVTPVVAWNTPGSIVYGTALGALQLNATAGGVAGSFVYTPPAGTILPVGTHSLSVQFTPSDTGTYSTPAATQVLLMVGDNYLKEDFEDDWADNALARTTNGWMSSALWDESSITNPAVGMSPLPRNVLFPILYNHMAQRRQLRLKTENATLRTPTLEASFAAVAVHLDMMVKFQILEKNLSILTNNLDQKAAIFLRASGAATNLVVYHGQKTADGFGEPVITTLTERLDAGTWYRLTVTLDATTNNSGAEAFCVRINGKPLTSAAAYQDTWKTRIFSPTYSPDNGMWFLSASRRDGATGTNLNCFTAIMFEGRGDIDDLVVTPILPTFSLGTMFRFMSSP